MITKEAIFENLDNCKDNGYFDKGGALYKATPEEIAEDMITCAADCEGYAIEDLTPAIKEWLDAHYPGR